MADENKIRLGSIWLTQDGTENGAACVSTVAGLSNLKMKWWGNAVRNARGNAEMNLVAVAGVDLTISIPSLPMEKVDQIVELFDGALDADETFEFEVDGDGGNYELAAEPNPDGSMSFGEIVGGWAENVEIRIITRGAGE